MSAHSGQSADGAAAWAPWGPAKRGGAGALGAKRRPEVRTGQSGYKELSKHLPALLSSSPGVTQWVCAFYSPLPVL